MRGGCNKGQPTSLSMAVGNLLTQLDRGNLLITTTAVIRESPQIRDFTSEVGVTITGYCHELIHLLSGDGKSMTCHTSCDATSLFLHLRCGAGQQPNLYGIVAESGNATIESCWKCGFQVLSLNIVSLSLYTRYIR